MQHDVQEFSRILQDKLEAKMKVCFKGPQELMIRAHRPTMLFPVYSRAR
jgi:hypothetical protein